jgi:hypothetical protein
MLNDGIYQCRWLDFRPYQCGLNLQQSDHLRLEWSPQKRLRWNEWCEVACLGITLVRIQVVANCSEKCLVDISTDTHALGGGGSLAQHGQFLRDIDPLRSVYGLFGSSHVFGSKSEGRLGSGSTLSPCAITRRGIQDGLQISGDVSAPGFVASGLSMRADVEPSAHGEYQTGQEWRFIIF